MQENGEKMGINIGVFWWECLYGEEMKMIAKLEEGMWYGTIDRKSGF